MSVPTYLQGNVRYKQTTGVTDVNTIISDVKTEATSLSPAWTDLGSNEIKSPVDAVGRFLKFKMTRISATQLEVLVTDPQGRSFTRRFDIAATSVIDIYVGQFHLVIDCTTNGEGCWVGILDLTPFPQNVHDLYVVGNATRFTDGSLDAAWDTTTVFHLLADGPPRTFGRELTLSQMADSLGGHDPGALSVAGAHVFQPIFDFGPATLGGTNRLRGRLYQILSVTGLLAAGTEKQVPVDESTTGTFRIVSFPEQTNVGFRYKMAVRKS